MVLDIATKESGRGDTCWKLYGTDSLVGTGSANEIPFTLLFKHEQLWKLKNTSGRRSIITCRHILFLKFP